MKVTMHPRFLVAMLVFGFASLQITYLQIPSLKIQAQPPATVTTPKPNRIVLPPANQNSKAKSERILENLHQIGTLRFL